MCFRRFFALSGALALCFSISVTSFAISDDGSEGSSDDLSISEISFLADDAIDDSPLADPDPDSSPVPAVDTSQIAQEVVDRLLGAVQPQVEDSSEPIQEIVVDEVEVFSPDGEVYNVRLIDEPVTPSEDLSFSVRSLQGSSVDVRQIGNEEPIVNVLPGTFWIKGRDPNLGSVVVYLPISAKDDIAVNANGYIYNRGNETINARIFSDRGGTVADGNFTYAGYLSRFMYRVPGASGYSNLALTPTDSNILIYDSASAYSLEQMQFFIIIFLLGVCLVCMRR